MAILDLDALEGKIIDKLTSLAENCNQLNPALFDKYQVKRGLRDADGRGVLVGLTEVGEVHSYIVDENDIIPVPGKLMYRGISITDLVAGFLRDDRYGFEETCYLLLFGKLPNREEIKDFQQLLGSYRKLPDHFVRDMILNVPSNDIMNKLARSVLALYSFDDKADDTSIKNVLKQCILLIACFPTLAVYGYQAFNRYHADQSLYIHSPRADYGTAENILHMLRPNSTFTKLEARLLDLALVLHAEHGGGNNSTFVTRVVTSSGTDTYSAMAAGLGSLKGPRHGGANIKVIQMLDHMKENLKSWKDDEEIESYLERILNKEAFDRSGLIYGMGHAVYTISDPRAVIFKEHVARLAVEKGLQDEYEFYSKVETLAPKVIGKVRNIDKGVSANIDFYSGFVYRMLEIPPEMYTPLFAISRISGWSAHRIEEIASAGKIIRPAYKCVAKRRPCTPMNER